MPRTLVPADIKPHLIPFLYQHFKGTTARINGKLVKQVDITQSSELGQLIRHLAKKIDVRPKGDITYSIFFSLEEYPRNRTFFGNFYKYVSGEHSYLHFPEEAIYLINAFLEQKMETAMLFFIYGWQNKDGEMGLLKGINLFCEKYNLYEFGYDQAAIRRKYYRWKNRIDFLDMTA